MYLNITSNKEDDTRDVADVVAAPAGQGFLLDRSLAPPSHQALDPEIETTGIEAASNRVAVFRSGGQRGDLRSWTTGHRPLAAHAAEEDAQQHRRVSPAATIDAALPRRGRRPRNRSPPPEEWSSNVLAATILGSRAPDFR
jgi:hypothetical protein